MTQTDPRDPDQDDDVDQPVIVDPDPDRAYEQIGDGSSAQPVQNPPQ